MDDSPVVAAVDGSQGSLLAVEWAAREAALRSQPLRIVSVPALPPRMVQRRGVLGAPATVADTVRAASEQAMTVAAERAAAIVPSLTVTTDLLAGPPAKVLAEIVWPGSLMVVGSRGAGGLSALILGSVSRYIADHGASPVVVVPAHGMIADRKVVAGIRDTDQLATLEFAFHEAALRKAELQILNAWDWQLLDALFPSALRSGAGPQEVTADAEQWLAELLSAWQDKYPMVKVSHRVENVPAAQALVEASTRADLLVLGRPLAGAGARGRGAVRHAVLHHAECPVAVVPG